MKIVIVAILLIVFFLVVVGLIMMWSGQSSDIASGIFDFLKNLGSFDTGVQQAPGGGTGIPSGQPTQPTTPPPGHQTQDLPKQAPSDLQDTPFRTKII